MCVFNVHSLALYYQDVQSLLDYKLSNIYYHDLKSLLGYKLPNIQNINSLLIVHLSFQIKFKTFYF